jgi:hypothetical protein
MMPYIEDVMTQEETDEYYKLAGKHRGNDYCDSCCDELAQRIFMPLIRENKAQAAEIKEVQAIALEHAKDQSVVIVNLRTEIADLEKLNTQLGKRNLEIVGFLPKGDTE